MSLVSIWLEFFASVGSTSEYTRPEATSFWKRPILCIIVLRFQRTTRSESAR